MHGLQVKLLAVQKFCGKLCSIAFPTIGLLRAEEKKDYTKGKYAMVKLRNIPNDPDSMT